MLDVNRSAGGHRVALWGRRAARARARAVDRRRGLSRSATAAVLASHVPEPHAGGWCCCGARFTPLHLALVLDAAGLVLVVDRDPMRG